MNYSSQTIFLLQLAALWILFAFLVKDYARDRLRENLFVIRDNLFDGVANGDGNFRAADYLHLRSYINQTIRRGHMVTPSRGLLYEILIRIPGVTGGVSPTEMRMQVNEEMKWLIETEKANERVKCVRKAVHKQLMHYYCLTSPIFLLIISVAIIAVICMLGMHGLKGAAQLAYEKYFGTDIDRGITTNGDLAAAC